LSESETQTVNFQHHPILRFSGRVWITEWNGWVPLVGREKAISVVWSLWWTDDRLRREGNWGLGGIHSFTAASSMKPSHSLQSAPLLPHYLPPTNPFPLSSRPISIPHLFRSYILLYPVLATSQVLMSLLKTPRKHEPNSIRVCLV